jgi:hypothetical protein
LVLRGWHRGGTRRQAAERTLRKNLLVGMTQADCHRLGQMLSRLERSLDAFEATSRSRTDEQLDGLAQ